MSKLLSISPDNSIGVVGEVEISTNQNIKDAVSSARKSFSPWSRLSVGDRVKILEKVYVALDRSRDELAELESREMGMPIEESKIDLDSGLTYFRWYLDNADRYLSPEVSFKSDSEVHTVYYEAVGVVAVIMPWNFPFSNFVWGVIPNLVAGNTVVFKHSEEVTVVCKRYEEIIQSTDSIPEGVLNFIYGSGDVGEKLVRSDIDMICFTGSNKTGNQLYKIGAEKMIKVLLELGGSAPGVVFKDADLDNVVETVILNRFGNCGQICDGLKRMVVHEDVIDEFVEKLKIRLEGMKVGSPIEEDTNVGPLVAQRQLVLLEEQVNDAIEKGANVIAGGGKPEGLDGAYYLPTILTNISKDMSVWKDEVFGPVLPVISFSTYEEAMELANDTEYGLGGYVFSSDSDIQDRASRDIKTGMVSVNGAFYVIPDNPFGGCKRSGIGREHGKWGLRELCDIKVVAKVK